MNKNEFLHALCEKLKEGLTASQMEEHVRYYSDYINQEESNGISEEEVIASLGDPVLLARTILETSSNETQRGGFYQEEAGETIYQEETSSQRRAMPFQMMTTSRWGCLALAIGLLLVLGLILWIFGVMFRVLMPVLLPVLIILFIIAVFKQQQ